MIIQIMAGFLIGVSFIITVSLLLLLHTDFLYSVIKLRIDQNQKQIKRYNTLTKKLKKDIKKYKEIKE